MSKPVNEILSRYEAEGIPISTLGDRVRHVVQSAFSGGCIVIFSGVAAKGRDGVLEEIRGTAEGPLL